MPSQFVVYLGTFMNKFAIYACPTGALAEQIQVFLGLSRDTWGANAAHASLPCCALIDLFEEQSGSLPVYTQSLERAYNRGLKSRPNPVLLLEGLRLTGDRLDLVLTAPWLRQVMVNFACTVKSPTRKVPLRMQERLHITLAHGYPANQASAYLKMAQETIHIDSPSHWEMRFYQRASNQGWIAQQIWEVGEGVKGEAAKPEAVKLETVKPEAVKKERVKKERVKKELVKGEVGQK
jgi:hypothetical protein